MWLTYMGTRIDPGNGHFPKSVSFVTTFEVFILISTGKYSSHLSSKKLHVAAAGDHYRNLQLVKMQNTTGHRALNSH